MDANFVASDDSGEMILRRDQSDMQTELNFDGLQHAGMDGIAAWRETRRQQEIECAKKLGLPLGSNVEVWLKQGICLRGKLRLQEEVLLHAAVDLQNPRLQIDRTPFSYSEMEGCVRTDLP